MSYIELNCLIKNENNDELRELLMAELLNVGFDSFEESELGMKAYIEKSFFSEDLLNQVYSLNNNPQIEFSYQPLEEKNWNEEWEKNYFQPIIIDDKCLIKSSFHTNTPQTKYTILIDPKMSFGTGHHETTSLMLEYILSCELTGKEVLDMGCGTGVLGILSSMCGANYVVGIDNDKWAYDNSLENLNLNQITNMKIIHGNVESIPERKFDYIFANINRNILLEDIKFYAKHLKNNGYMVVSGFYSEDLPMIQEEATRQHFQFCNQKEKNRWIAAQFNFI